MYNNWSVLFLVSCFSKNF